MLSVPRARPAPSADSPSASPPGSPSTPASDPPAACFLQSRMQIYTHTSITKTTCNVVMFLLSEGELEYVTCGESQECGYLTELIRIIAPSDLSGIPLLSTRPNTASPAPRAQFFVHPDTSYPPLHDLLTHCDGAHQSSCGNSL